MSDEWTDPFEGVDWDMPEEIELLKDGEVICASCDLDVGFNGEDEYPIPILTLADGRRVSIYDYDGWRAKS